MKTVIFELKMPGCGSWNGRWSGEGRVYAVTRRLPDSKASEIDGKTYGYAWDDGWCASIDCRVSSGTPETRSIRRRSSGFCGYEWMVASILSKGQIEVPS